MTEDIKVYYAVDWLLDDLVDAPSESEMSYRYNERKPFNLFDVYLKLANILREHSRGLENAIFSDQSTDLIFEHEGDTIAASSPRPYMQYIYDCAKSDIVVVGPKRLEAAITKRLKEEKQKALAEKLKIKEYIVAFEPYFNELHDSGLIDGLLGRGSYFEKMGFPVNNDNFNFILLRENNWNEDEKKRMYSILKRTPALHIWVQSNNEEVIGSGSGERVVYFALISKYSVMNYSLGLRYEKYVLENSPGIELPNLSKSKSELLAKELAAFLPNHNTATERGIPRLRPSQASNPTKP